MFGHLQRAISSGSHKLLPSNERLGSTRSNTNFAFVHFVPWRHHTRSKIKVGRRYVRTNKHARTAFFFQLGIQEREADQVIKGQLHLLGS